MRNLGHYKSEQDAISLETVVRQSLTTGVRFYR